MECYRYLGTRIGDIVIEMGSGLEEIAMLCRVCLSLVLCLSLKLPDFYTIFNWSKFQRDSLSFRSFFPDANMADVQLLDERGKKQQLWLTFHSIVSCYIYRWNTRIWRVAKWPNGVQLPANEKTNNFLDVYRMYNIILKHFLASRLYIDTWKAKLFFKIFYRTVPW